MNHPLVVCYFVSWSGWIWGLTSHKELRSYGGETSIYSLVIQAGEAQDRTYDSGLQGE